MSHIVLNIYRYIHSCSPSTPLYNIFTQLFRLTIHGEGHHYLIHAYCYII